MTATVPAGSESFSYMGRRAHPPRAVSRRSGWLTAMVTEAQEQLHRGIQPVEPPMPYYRRQPVTVQPAPLLTPMPPPLPPTLQHIEREDLTDIQRVLMLYNQAVQQRLIGSSEAERLTFVALAQHVLSCRPKSAGGLFRHLLKQKRYHCVTQADEDVALRQLKQHLYGRVL